MAAMKWKEYVERLGRAENQVKKAINEWRNYKTFIQKQRYEAAVAEKNLQYLDVTPRELLERIKEAKIKVKFCELKIQYYREIETKGVTMKNKKLRESLNAKAAAIVHDYHDLISDL